MFAYICFIIVFVPPIYDDNVNLMLYLSKRVFYFWFVLLRKVKVEFHLFLGNQTENFGDHRITCLERSVGLCLLTKSKTQNTRKNKKPY